MFSFTKYIKNYKLKGGIIMLGLIGIIISLGLLMYLAYKGISVIILAPVLALLAVLFQEWPDSCLS